MSYFYIRLDLCDIYKYTSTHVPEIESIPHFFGTLFSVLVKLRTLRRKKIYYMNFLDE